MSTGNGSTFGTGMNWMYRYTSSFSSGKHSSPSAYGPYRAGQSRKTGWRTSSRHGRKPWASHLPDEIRVDVRRSVPGFAVRRFDHRLTRWRSTQIVVSVAVVGSDSRAFRVIDTTPAVREKPRGAPSIPYCSGNQAACDATVLNIGLWNALTALCHDGITLALGNGAYIKCPE